MRVLTGSNRELEREERERERERDLVSCRHEMQPKGIIGSLTTKCALIPECREKNTAA